MSELVQHDSDGHLPANPDAPGLPAHQLRRTDVDPIATQRAERQVSLLFIVSMLATVGFIVAFVAYPSPLTYVTIITGILEPSASNFVLGMSLTVALLGIGIGAIHWAKKLMSDVEVVELRHPSASSAKDREEFQEALGAGVES